MAERNRRTSANHPRVPPWTFVCSIAATAVLTAGTASAASVNRPRPARQLVTPQAERAVSVGGHLDSEAVNDTAGGLRRGTTYDTVLHLGVSFDTAALGLWRGGRLHVSAVHISSGQADGHLIGDVQGSSNLAAPDANRIYQFWYRQRWGDSWNARVGWIDLNQYLLVADNAQLLINASFGLMPSMSLNLPASTYPKPGFGILLHEHDTRGGTRIAVFQGRPGHRGEAFDSGMTAVAERTRGNFKFGAWDYRQRVNEHRSSNWGAYAIWDGVIAEPGGRVLKGFIQAGLSPRITNLVPYYLGAGLNMPAPIAGRARDRLSAGLACAWVRREPAAAETVWELTYSAALSRHLYLQPDLQYIIHPGGQTAVGDATVATLRLHIEFD
jgi:porin